MSENPMQEPNLWWEPDLNDSSECPRCGAYGLYTARQARAHLRDDEGNLDRYVAAALGDMSARAALYDVTDADSLLRDDDGNLRLIMGEAWCPACGEVLAADELPV